MNLTELCSLKIKSDNTASTTEPIYVVSWDEIEDKSYGGDMFPKSSRGSLTGATAVTVVTAPTGGIIAKKVTGLLVYNADTATRTITVYHTYNSSNYTEAVIELTAGRTLQYDGNKFSVSGTASSFLITADATDATAAEITRKCDVSARKVSLTATTAITETTHEGKICVITGTAAAAYTLPEATGSGAEYTFLIGQVTTSGNVFHTADSTNCGFYGSVNLLDKDAAAQTAYAPASTDDLITLNGTTTGGQIGDRIDLVDMATDKWCITGQLTCPSGSNPATPFSGT